MNRFTHTISIILVSVSVVLFECCETPTDHMQSSTVYYKLNVVGTDGTNHQVIADDGWRAIPTDSSIIFQTERKLFKVNYDGSGLVQLFPEISWGDQSLSPDGRKIFLVSGYYDPDGYVSECYLMDPDGTNLQKLDHPRAQYTWPRISPQLDKIVFCRNGSLATINTDGTGMHFIKTKTDSAYYSFAVFIDENRILYFQTINSIHSFRLFNEVTLEDKFVGTNSGGFPAWSSSVAGSNLLIADDSIMMFDLESEKKLNVGKGWGASFSKDGSQIVAYQGADIYVIDPIGKTMHIIYSEQDSGKYISNPLFSPDGNHIVFQTSWSVY